jgi:hypothetical protein
MINIRNIINQASDTVLNSAAAAGIGYLCARAFMAINPVHVAVASAISVVVSKVTDPIFDKIFAGEKASKASKFLGNVLNITTSVAASAGIATALGFEVSFASFLYVNAVTIAAFAAVTLGVFAAASAAAYISGKSGSHAQDTATPKAV